MDATKRHSEPISWWLANLQLTVDPRRNNLPRPFGRNQQNLWAELLADSGVELVPTDSEGWVDPVCQTGTCASYAILPTNRAGVPDTSRINVVMEDGSSRLCGDALPPTSAVRPSYTYRFTNSTECYDMQQDWNACYELNMTWTWLRMRKTVVSHGTSTEWMLNHRKSIFDLQHLVTGLVGMQGEEGTFDRSSLEVDGIRPMRTYYYVLTVDSKETDTFEASDNILRVKIEDQWWDYSI